MKKSIKKIKEFANEHPVITMVSTGILTGGLYVVIPPSIQKKAQNKLKEQADYENQVLSQKIGFV